MGKGKRGEYKANLVIWGNKGAQEVANKSNVDGADSARNKINVIIAEGRAGEKGPMRVKCRAHYWRGAVVVQETAMRLIGGEGGAVHVECFDFMTICAAAEILGWNLETCRAERVTGEQKMPSRKRIWSVEELERTW